MKKGIVFLFILGAQLAKAQTIRIADNNPNAPTGTNIYPNVQAAHDAALAGDIVYVQPSLTGYGNLTINRPVTLRGIGFNTGKDLAYTSILGNITLTNKVDGTSDASNTVIEGVVASTINLGTLTGSFTYTIQNITIQNCSFAIVNRSAGYVAAQNITIKGCVGSIVFVNSIVNQLLITGNYIVPFFSYCIANGSAFHFENGSVTSCIVSNNIFAQSAQNGFNNTSITSLVIANNNFLGGNDIANSRFISSFCVSHSLTDALVTNNIFFGCAPIGASAQSFVLERNSFTNNLSFGTTNNALPPAGTGVGNTGSNNIVNQDPLFVNAPYNTVYASTMNFNLQASSPAKNAGSDGTDIGITGGAYPVTAGNILLKPTAAPVMISLNPAAMVPQNQPLKTNIKAKSN